MSGDGAPRRVRLVEDQEDVRELERAAADGGPPVVLCTAWDRQPHVLARVREGGAVDVIDKAEMVTRLPEVLRALAG